MGCAVGAQPVSQPRRIMKYFNDKPVYNPCPYRTKGQLVTFVVNEMGVKRYKALKMTPKQLRYMYYNKKEILGLEDQAERVIQASIDKMRGK